MEMDMPLIYKGFDVVTRVGGSAIIIKARMEKGVIQSQLGGDYNCLFILDKYNVDFYSFENMKGSGGSFIFSLKNLRGYSGIRKANEDLELEFEIPVSSRLIDCINEIRRKKRFFGLAISYSLNIAQLGGSYSIKSITGNLERVFPDGSSNIYMPFYTDEIDELMKKLGYMEVARLEIPVPIISEIHVEIINNCINELKNVEDSIAKGNYPEALRISRNIIMNYLTELTKKEEGKGRILKGEVREYILSRIPSDCKSIYEEILDGIENALISNLACIHKFIKEDTGKLVAMPSREEAEYIYLMLISILRYISQLTITWK
ncbi:MAG: hypothetical protein LM601_08035 [Candidatus Verstraetearchaeota archaeon]|nr:hypothetical protein [Candidatus Verstraetearchaeota archaeon]